MELYFNSNAAFKLVPWPSLPSTTVNEKVTYTDSAVVLSICTLSASVLCYSTIVAIDSGCQLSKFGHKHYVILCALSSITCSSLRLIPNCSTGPKPFYKIIRKYSSRARLGQSKTKGHGKGHERKEFGSWRRHVSFLPFAVSKVYGQWWPRLCLSIRHYHYRSSDHRGVPPIRLLPPAVIILVIFHTSTTHTAVNSDPHKLQVVTTSCIPSNDAHAGHGPLQLVPLLFFFIN